MILWGGVRKSAVLPKSLMSYFSSQPLILRRKLNVASSWTESHLPKCFLKYFSPCINIPLSGSGLNGAGLGFTLVHASAVLFNKPILFSRTWEMGTFLLCYVKNNAIKDEGSTAWVDCWYHRKQVICVYFLFLPKPSVLLHLVCSFTHGCYLLGPINNNLCYFVAKSVCCITCKFSLQKFARVKNTNIRYVWRLMTIN